MSSSIQPSNWLTSALLFSCGKTFFLMFYYFELFKFVSPLIWKVCQVCLVCDCLCTGNIKFEYIWETSIPNYINFHIKKSDELNFIFFGFLWNISDSSSFQCKPKKLFIFHLTEVGLVGKKIKDPNWHFFQQKKISCSFFILWTLWFHFKRINFLSAIFCFVIWWCSICVNIFVPKKIKEIFWLKSAKKKFFFCLFFKNSSIKTVLETVLFPLQLFQKHHKEFGKIFPSSLPAQLFASIFTKKKWILLCHRDFF